jgi:uncharacterized protein (DUF1684 family)
VKNVIALLFIALLVFSCKPKADPKYKAEIDKWHKERIERLKRPDGWLSLVGLFWLKEGENTFGSDSSNDIIFPKWKARPFMGSFFLDSNVVTVKMTLGLAVNKNDNKLKEIRMVNDIEGIPTILRFGSLSWNIIKRSGDMYGVRLRDSESKLIKNFKGIERFDVNPEWRIEATFIPYNPPKKISVPSIIGTIDEEISPGKLEFIYDDQKYSVDVIYSDGKYFLIFADLTNGESTYGAGRFLMIERENEKGKTIIDFNKAYNPPCAFTKYATCPLPPKQNMLKLKIEAGEKKYGHGKH